MTLPAVSAAAHNQKVMDGIHGNGRRSQPGVGTLQHPERHHVSLAHLRKYHDPTPVYRDEDFVVHRVQGEPSVGRSQLRLGTTDHADRPHVPVGVGLEGRNRVKMIQVHKDFIADRIVAHVMNGTAE